MNRKIHALMVAAGAAAALTTASAKGPLDLDVARFAKESVNPLLISRGLCTSRQDCREKEYFFCTSWTTISCTMYGIADKDIVASVIARAKSSGFKFATISFYKSARANRGMFEGPYRIERF